MVTPQTDKTPELQKEVWMSVCENVKRETLSRRGILHDDPFIVSQ